jgi:hypothetical protein
MSRKKRTIRTTSPTTVIRPVKGLRPPKTSR